jgi:hypothetical protein
VMSTLSSGKVPRLARINLLQRESTATGISKCDP